MQTALLALSYLTLDLLFLASFCYGMIEITVACMLLQIILDLHQSAAHFINGDLFAGICQATLAGAHIYQAIPQIRTLQWTWEQNPVLSAELKQAENGFTYLDIPDEYVHSLFKLCDDAGVELPPYFGEGLAGAHVSAILGDEISAAGSPKISEIGRKFDFRIVNWDSLKPAGWNGVDKVYFLTLSCPELESVRSTYGFSPKIHHDHDFHLTFGIHRESAPIQELA